jgi:hypothetical protein
MNLIRAMLAHRVTSPFGFYALGLGVGATVGGILVRQAMAERSEDILQKEVKRAQLYYKTLYKREEYEVVPAPNGEENAKPAPLGEVDTDYAVYTDYARLYTVPERSNADGPNKDDPIPLEKLQEASYHPVSDERPEPGRTPYLITEEEFRYNEPSNAQVEWTYYEEDGALVDETDTVVSLPERTIGEYADLSRFDEYSDDNVCVYIRNDQLRLDVLITIDYGSWEKNVLGYDEEDSLQHDAARAFRKVRKFRSDDG